MHTSDSRRAGLANVPTAIELGYETSDLYAIERTEQMELGRGRPTAPTEAWLRIDAESFIYDVEGWR